LLYEGFDFIFQQLLRAASNHEVVRVPNQVYLGVVADFGLGEMLQQEPFEAVQRQVCQGWRNYSALWCSFFGRVEDVLLHVAGLQPFVEDGGIDWDVCHQPLMTDPIEARLDVPFEYPFWRSAFCQRLEALFDRVCCGPFRAKAIGVGIGPNFRDGRESEQVEGLHRAVVHRGHPPSPLPQHPNLFRNR
jgi:hypothetical protein